MAELKEVDKVKRYVYKFPLLERVLVVGKGSEIGKKEKCVFIKTKDGKAIGLFVRYDWNEKDQLRDIDSLARRYLITLRDSWCLVPANHPAEALRIFREEWEGAKMGGFSEESKALRINHNKPIIEFPSCDSRCMVSSDGYDRFLCQRFYEETIDCAVMGDDYEMEECPVSVFWEKFSELKEKDGTLLSKTQGYKFILSQNIMQG